MAIVPLRPGLVLLNSTRVTPDNCPKLFEKWDKIWFDDCIAQTAAIPGGIAPCSTYIGMNILSIDPDTVVIDEAQLPLIKTLEAYGITCIPIQFRHAMTLSGGLHCLTLDLIREGEKKLMSSTGFFWIVSDSEEQQQLLKWSIILAKRHYPELPRCVLTSDKLFLVMLR